MQKRKHSLIESIVNTTVGLITSFCIQLIIYPLMGIPVKLYQNVIITMVFYFASVLRNYVIRRYFNK